MHFKPSHVLPAIALSLAAYILPTSARAEGNCPPGFYPTGGDAAGWHACAPMGPMEEEGEADEESGGGYSDGLPPIHYDPELWKIWMEESRKAEEWREAERLNNPTYRRLKQGYWEYVSADPSDPKQICMATFLTVRGGVLLMDWAGEHRGTFLAFFSASVPRTDRIERQRFSLTQSGETQTVQAFHAPLPWERKLGMVMFAVPSTEALLTAIEDVQDFEVKAGNDTFAWGEWHSGHQARDHLRQCVNNRSR